MALEIRTGFLSGSGQISRRCTAFAAVPADEQVGRRAGQAVEQGVVRSAVGAAEVRLRGPPRIALRQAAGRGHQVAWGQGASCPGPRMARFYTPATGGPPLVALPPPEPAARANVERPATTARAPGLTRRLPAAAASTLRGLRGGGESKMRAGSARPGPAAPQRVAFRSMTGSRRFARERSAVRLIGSIYPHRRPCSTAPVRSASGDRALLLASSLGRG